MLPDWRGRSRFAGSWTRTPNRLGDYGSAGSRHGNGRGTTSRSPRSSRTRLLANKHHLLAGDQALRVAAGFGLARFCPQVRLAALTEHVERYTLASESLPANLRKTMPAHDMRSCILNRVTKCTRLEAQWSTTRDCLFSLLDMGTIGWVETHFVYGTLVAEAVGSRTQPTADTTTMCRHTVTSWQTLLLCSTRRRS